MPCGPHLKQRPGAGRTQPGAKALPVAVRVAVHGRQAGQGLVGGAAPSEGLQEQLLVGAKLGHPHLVVKELESRSDRRESLGSDT